LLIEKNTTTDNIITLLTHYFGMFRPFLPCDAMPSQAVCLSVSLSITRRYSVEMATYILKLF